METPHSEGTMNRASAEAALSGVFLELFFTSVTGDPFLGLLVGDFTR